MDQNDTAGIRRLDWSARLRRGRCAMDETARGGQPAMRFGGAYAGQQHDDGGFDLAFRFPVGFFDFGGGRFRGKGDYPFGAMDKLLIGRIQINHQIAVHLPDPDHGGGGQHIEDQLAQSRISSG